MVRCNRCDGYVSRDYARVFGDNHDDVTSCPDCPPERADSDGGREEGSERKLTFRMSEFETDERRSGTDGSGVASSDGREVSKVEPSGGRFGRVGKAVSGLF